MKILLLDGDPRTGNQKIDGYLKELSYLLNQSGNETMILKLKEMTIHYCTGCYTCWLKTPGICMFKDDGAKLLSEYINSDIVIFASPIIMGFVSSLLKNVSERILPLIHPFLCVERDRTKHLPRYGRYPAVGMLLEKSDHYDETSAEIIDKVFKSMVSRKYLFTKLMESSPEEVVHEINSI